MSNDLNAAQLDKLQAEWGTAFDMGKTEYPIDPATVLQLIQLVRRSTSGSAIEFPAGALHNGEEYANRLENIYDFQCEAGPLRNCYEWTELRRCMAAVAEYVQASGSDDKSSGKAEFLAHLQGASDMVATWPSWKQGMFAAEASGRDGTSAAGAVVLPRELAQRCLSSMKQAVTFGETGQGRPPSQTCMFEIEELEAILSRSAAATNGSEQAPASQPAATVVAADDLYTLRRLIECAEVLDERPRPMCRDCADENGTCPNGGLECDMPKLFAAAKALYNRLATPPAPTRQPLADERSLLSQWRDAYTAFVGTFDTPQMRLQMRDEYSVDARKRLRDFGEHLEAALAQPILSPAIEQQGGEPVYQIASDHTPSGWSDVTRAEYDAHTNETWRKKRIVYAAPTPAAEAVPKYETVLLAGDHGLINDSTVKQAMQDEIDAHRKRAAMSASQADVKDSK